jgi:methylthioribulose-1-phosphate dehydratase
MSVDLAPPVVASPEMAEVCAEMVDHVRLLSARGWTPATSSNFSCRVPGHDDVIAITKSGIDKAFFKAGDMMIVDREGERLWPEGVRSSAETPLHVAIYDLFDAGAVLHTHSVNATAVSLRHGPSGVLTFSGLELLKGFRGITTHETSVDVPIFPNDQDMDRLAAVVRPRISGHPIFGFLIAGHGLYTWGHTIGEARRHLEVFEFLFELDLRLQEHQSIVSWQIQEGVDHGSPVHSRRKA